MEQWTSSKLGKEYVKTILLPCLFNLFSEYITQNARLDEAQAGLMFAGRNSNNLRYTDDTTLMAESKEQLTSSNDKAVYLYPAYLTSMQSTSCKMLGW